MDEITQRYRIMDLPLEGTISEIYDPIPYSNGSGFFRNVVLAVPGVLDTQAYVPVTVFGTDATTLDPQLDTGRRIQCTGRLTSRRYVDRNGTMRWAMSLAATGVMLGPRRTMDPPDGGMAEAAQVAGEQNYADDIPF